MGTIVNLNGALLPPEEAKLSVYDHAFLYGDSIYEAIRTHGGVAFLLDPHLDRMALSAERVGLRLPWERARLCAEVHRTVEAAGNPESVVRIVVTRGVGPITLDTTACGAPNVVMYGHPLPEIPPGFLQKGCDVVIPRVRRNAPDALDPAIKSGNLLNNILAFAEARAAGAFEAIFLSHHGLVSEGTTSNVFTVKSGRIRTPRAGSGLLLGITRALVLDLAREIGIPSEEADIPPQELLEADEVFITSTTKGVLPVGRVDGHPVGTGRAGPVALALRAAYDRFAEEESRREKARRGAK